MKFHYGISVSGQLHASYVFKTKKDVENWKKKELLELESFYGPLQLRGYELPGLEVGDSCWVVGEGDEVFKILGLHRYEPYRWGFSLDSGWAEEVAKCRKIGEFS